MARKLQQEYEECSVTLNVKVSNNREDNSRIKNCQEYKYLGLIFDNTGTDNNEIRSKLSKAKGTVGSLNSIFWNKDMGKRRKYNIYNTMVKSSLLFGAEAWG